MSLPRSCATTASSGRAAPSRSGERAPGLRIIIPFVDVLHRVSLRIVTMPIQSQGITTRDNVSVDISAVAVAGRLRC